MGQAEDLIDRGGDIIQDQRPSSRTQLLIQDGEGAQSIGSGELHSGEVQMNDRSARLSETSVDDAETLCGQHLLREPQ
jgi:hypothetical protein